MNALLHCIISPFFRISFLLQWPLEFGLAELLAAQEEAILQLRDSCSKVSFLRTWVLQLENERRVSSQEQGIGLESLEIILSYTWIICFTSTYHVQVDKLESFNRNLFATDNHPRKNV